MVRKEGGRQSRAGVSNYAEGASNEWQAVYRSVKWVASGWGT